MSGDVITFTSNGKNLYQKCPMLSVRDCAGPKVLYRYRYIDMEEWMYIWLLFGNAPFFLSEYWLGNGILRTMLSLCWKSLRWKDCSLVPLTSDGKRKGLSGLVLQDNPLSTPDPISLDATFLYACQCWLSWGYRAAPTHCPTCDDAFIYNVWC